jgi:Na+/H+ antiporter NhaC
LNGLHQTSSSAQRAQSTDALASDTFAGTQTSAPNKCINKQIGCNEYNPSAILPTQNMSCEFYVNFAYNLRNVSQGKIAHNKGRAMEGFDLISTGAWSIVPPLLALALALVTKEVYSSLTVGVFVGMVIYQFSLNGAGVDQLISSFTMVPQMMAEQISGNGALLLFLALLGALTVVIAVSGGSRAYAQWVATHIKSARMAQVLTAILGIIIFVDDYFNCLTVGAVMRPVTDRFHISREKLAWVIDSTAAPICIIAPVSSWAVAVGGYMGDGGFNTFVASIPYNFYALLTIFFVFFMLFTNEDFGSMKAAEEACRKNKAPAENAVEEAKLEAIEAGVEASTLIKATAGDVSKDGGVLPPKITEWDDIQNAASSVEDEYKGLTISEHGRVFDLVIPILVLIIFAIVGMLYCGGFFEGVDFATAVGEDPVMGLCIGACVALVCAGIMYLPRKLCTLGGFVDAMSEGVRSMVGAIMILVLAWSLGGVCRYMLGTGVFVSGVLTSLGVGLDFLPAVIFVVAAFIGFAMGTSWGTVALILPIVIGVFDASDPLFLLAIGATLAGAVYGDHISPISDTTILSSAGAKCNHLRHVSTQLPYATLVMVVCLIGYIVAGFTKNPWISLALGVVLIVVSVLVLHKISGNKKAA